MLDWRTVGEQRHLITDRRRDADGKGYVVTVCGWMIWPSRHDTVMRDARVCLQCADLAEQEGPR